MFRKRYIRSLVARIIIFIVGLYMYKDTQNFEIDQKMSIYIKPFDIHIMKKEFTMNTYNGYIDKNNKTINGKTIPFEKP